MSRRSKTPKSILIEIATTGDLEQVKELAETLTSILNARLKAAGATDTPRRKRSDAGQQRKKADSEQGSLAV